MARGPLPVRRGAAHGRSLGRSARRSHQLIVVQEFLQPRHSGQQVGVVREEGLRGQRLRIGDFGGGWLGHPRQWLGAQWPGRLPLGVSEPPRAGRRAPGRRRGRARALPSGAFDRAARALISTMLSDSCNSAAACACAERAEAPRGRAGCADCADCAEELCRGAMPWFVCVGVCGGTQT